MLLHLKKNWIFSDNLLKRPKRTLPGMKRCGGCVTCPYVRPGKKINATATKYSVDINKAVDCKTKNVIYHHRGYVNNKKTDKATGLILIVLVIKLVICK